MLLEENESLSLTLVTLRFDSANSSSYFSIHTSKTYEEQGNSKPLNTYGDVGLDPLITLKNASLHTWYLCFPL